MGLFERVANGARKSDLEGRGYRRSKVCNHENAETRQQELLPWHVGSHRRNDRREQSEHHRVDARHLSCGPNADIEAICDFRQYAGDDETVSAEREHAEC